MSLPWKYVQLQSSQCTGSTSRGGILMWYYVWHTGEGEKEAHVLYFLILKNEEHVLFAKITFFLMNHIVGFDRL